MAHLQLPLSVDEPVSMRLILSEYWAIVCLVCQKKIQINASQSLTYIFRLPECHVMLSETKKLVTAT